RPLSRNESSSFSAGISSPSAAAVAYILHHNSPEQLHETLLTAVSKAPLSLKQYQIDALLDILYTASIPFAHVAEEAVANRISRHCAHCHRNYLEKNNGRLVCIVDHDTPQ
ncbi:hypothetical protein C8R47DRAFT_932208, partial [Mycena vitilis]